LETLTQRQREIFDFIVRTFTTSLHTPTLCEIAEHFGYGSSTGARDHVLALEKKGMISRERGKARSIQITDPVTLGGLKQSSPKWDDTGFGIPVLGRIAAGPPIEAIEQCDRFLPVSSSLFGSREVFGLEICGDSMIGEGIHQGDIAIIARQPTVESGEIAAVVIEGEATLKFLIRESHKLILRAANSTYPDIIVDSKSEAEVRIAGKYVGLVRSENRKAGLAA
jgi:repressor LexA